MRRIAAIIVITSLFLSLSVFAFHDQPARAQSGTIIINPDGSITPSNANITTSDKVTYTFNGSNYLPIVVNRSNTIISGNRYTLQAQGGNGFSLTGMSNVTIKDTTITGSYDGIYLESSLNNTISGNNIENNTEDAVSLLSSSYNTVFGNNITNGYDGIDLLSSDNNSLIQNSIIANSNDGICLVSSGNRNFYSGNRIFHNDFVNNSAQAVCLALHSGEPPSNNTWDNGYPSGGNYWSDYRTAYPNAVENDSSAIWNTPYVIDANNIDKYPLMGPFHTFGVGTWNGVAYSVDTVSNSTLSNFNFNATAKTLSFNVTGTSSLLGFCRVAIPLSLISCVRLDDWAVTVNRAQLPLYLNVTTNGNYTYIYFIYMSSADLVTITSTSAVPEFQPFLFLPLFMMATLLAVAIYRRKRLQTKFS